MTIACLLLELCGLGLERFEDGLSRSFRRALLRHVRRAEQEVASFPGTRDADLQLILFCAAHLGRERNEVIGHEDDHPAVLGGHSGNLDLGSRP